MKTLINVFRTTELRNKILFTIGILVLYRLGAQIPAPGVSLDGIIGLRDQADQNEGGVFGYLSLFTGGGAVLNLFGLGILPYITSSIVMQILTVAVPKLEEWQAQGAVGQRKITQWTRYVAVVLALIQASSLTFLISRNPEQLFGFDPGLYPSDAGFGLMSLTILCVVAGTALLMWMGEMITERGLGNGMSVLIFASVVGGLPGIGQQIYQVKGLPWLLVSLVLLVALCLGIIFIEQGQRRIPINFPKRVVGRRQYGGNKTYIPLKVNQAGVIPVIFASSLLQLPSLVATSLPTNPTNPNWGDSVRQFIQDRLFTPTDPVYITIFGLLIVGFAYFYNAIAFDPARRADELRKSGGFITGVRPGPQTETYLTKILNRITLPGSLFLAAIALIPSAALFVLLGGGGGNSVGLLGFSGISILIGVGVSLELMKQINSQLMAKNYEGFLK